MLDDKRDKDIIGILALGIRAGLLEDFPGFVANAASARIELLKIGGGCLRPSIAANDRSDLMGIAAIAKGSATLAPPGAQFRPTVEIETSCRLVRLDDTENVIGKLVCGFAAV